jgi:PAS domain S-box-containing protein
VDRWAVPRALRGETATNALYTLRRKDSGETWVGSYSFAPIRVGGEIVGSVTIGRDVTDATRAEQALRESELRFRLALRNSPVSVAAQDRELRYIWAFNPRTARSEDLIGKRDADIFTPEEAARLTVLKRRVLDEGVESRETLWLDRPSGRIFIDVCFEPLRDQAGRVVGVASATVDLTASKLAEERLAAARERLAVTLQSIGDAVIATDEQARVTLMNPTAER